MSFIFIFHFMVMAILSLFLTLSLVGSFSLYSLIPPLHVGVLNPTLIGA